MRALQIRLHILQKWALRHYKKTILLTGLVYLLSVASLSGLQILTSIDDLTDSSFNSYSGLQILKEEFISSNNLTLFLSSQTTFTKEDFCLISKKLREIKLHFDGLDYILTSQDLKELEFKDNRFAFKPYFNLNCHIKEDYDRDLSKIFSEIQNTTPWSDIVVSKNSFDFMISFYFSESENTQNGSLNISRVGELKKTWEDYTKGHSKIKAHWIGDGIFQYYLRKGYDKIVVLNLIAILFTLLLFKLVLGTYKSGLLYVISISITSSIVFGGMALTNSPMDVLSNSISLMLFVSSIEDFIFLSYLKSKTTSWRLPFKKILVPSFLTSLTTFIGFGSLYFTDLEIIKRFGLWAAIGALVEWIVMFYFMPALLKKFQGLQNWVDPEVCQKRFQSLSKLGSLSFKKTVSYLLLITIPLSLFGASKIMVEDSPQDIFPKSHPGQVDVDYVSKTRGWKAPVSLIFENDENKEFNQSVLNSYKESDFVKVIENPYEVEDHLLEKLRPRGLDKLVLKEWKKSFFGRKYYSSETNQLRSLLYLDNLDLTHTQELIQFNNSLCPKGECFLAGSLISYAEFGSKILSSLFSSFMLSLFLVGLVVVFLCFHFGLNLKTTFSLLAASFWGPMTLMSLFYIFGISITYVTSLIASIMVGLAGDNAIQFLYKKKTLFENATFYQGCSLFITFCMIAISSAFFFSDFVQIQKLGFFMVIGFVLNYIGDVCILKGLNR